MTTKLNRFSKIFLSVSALTLGVAGVAVASPGHQALPTAYAKPAALVAQSGPAKMKGKRHARNAKAPAKQARKARRLAKFDANGNGKIEKFERVAIRKQRFVSLDANGNGSITLGEMQHAKAMRKADRQAKRSTRQATRTPEQNAKQNQRIAKRQAKRNAKRQRRNAPSMGERFAKLDADKSGAVSQTEFVQRKRQGKGKRQGKRRSKRQGRRS